MNEGYLSMVLACITFILIASGWKDILVRGFSHKHILLFFAVWAVGELLSFQVGPLAIYGFFFLLLAITVLAARQLRHPLLIGHALLSALLLGLLLALLQEMNGWIPWLAITSSRVDAALLVGLLSAMLNRSPSWQFVAISGGWITGVGMILVLHPAISGANISIGGPSFGDGWWVSFGVARLLSVALDMGHRTLAAVNRVRRSRKEWRRR